jgi:hypothetical protein
VHQAVLVGASLYVPGAGGTVFRVDAAQGVADPRINPFGASVDPSIFVAGPLSADAGGTVYYGEPPSGASTPPRWTATERPTCSTRTAPSTRSRPTGRLAKRTALGAPLGAAYTPLSLDGSGRVYAQNAGHLFVLGR